jgi:hypothetical protein
VAKFCKLSIVIQDYFPPKSLSLKPLSLSILSKAVVLKYLPCKIKEDNSSVVKPNCLATLSAVYPVPNIF